MNQSSVNDQSLAVNKLLTKDNARLKKENDSLKEQINSYKCVMSDLNLKVKDLENEKNSLVTVIKIIQNDQEQQQASWTVANNRKKTTEGRNTSAHNPVGTKNVKAKESVQQKNQYTALSISDVDDSESDSNNVSDNRSDDITATQVPKQDQRHERNRHSKKDSQQVKEANIPKNTKHNRPTVAILGDSMLKHLNPRKIQHGLDHKVTIKTFPGAGVDEMIHYVRPTLQKKTNHVVLHVGTNDLQTKSPDTLITAISRLGETITQEGNGNELTLSEVITRNDNANLADKVNVFNKKLDELCTEHNCRGLIKHDNITKVHLNNYGLHLNQKGTSTLAGNVKQFLKNQVFD
ncbi:Furin [Paramuricea clavata]|uniref:Furin, partial n=1 Tax=Paramuricea clavata TaxID=317549 RepID=A0A7D9L140_PARCT|nr:Furin [Paramuricea clavata]